MNVRGTAECFAPQNNGEISNSIVQNWTEQAIECFSLSGNCAQCSIRKGHYSFVCQMPKIVDVLIKDFGKPKYA